MDREIEVHIDWEGATRPVGRLWARAKVARQTCSFAYESAWLGLAGAFPLDPNLPLVRGDAHWDGGLLNAFSDPAPDRWGRNLMGRRERHHAELEDRAPRTLLEADFPMLVEDQTRLGARRFRDVGAEAFQAADAHPVPPPGRPSPASWAQHAGSSTIERPTRSCAYYWLQDAHWAGRVRRPRSLATTGRC